MSPSVWSIQSALKSEDLVCCETSGCSVLLGVLPSLHSGVHGTYPDDTAIGGQQGWKVLVAVTVTLLSVPSISLSSESAQCLATSTSDQ